MKLLGASLLDQVTEHELNFKAIFRVCQCAIGEEIKFDPEVSHVVQLDFLLLVPDHETPCIEAELLKLEPGRKYIVMVLELARARLQTAIIVAVGTLLALL